MVQMGIRDLCDEQPHPFVKRTEIPPRKKGSLQDLDNLLKTSKSSLSSTATHPIGGVGVVPATVMCILESPSSMEDRTGEALTGPEGELLKKMLSAIDLDINTQTYVGYLSPWRAPGARILTAFEIQEGLTLLKERIQIVQPKVLLLMGMPVAKALLNVPLGEARSKKHDFQGIPVFTTFAPSFLLKNEAYKKSAWSDLKKFQTFIKEN